MSPVLSLALESWPWKNGPPFCRGVSSSPKSCYGVLFISFYSRTLRVPLGSLPPSSGRTRPLHLRCAHCTKTFLDSDVLWHLDLPLRGFVEGGVHRSAKDVETLVCSRTHLSLRRRCPLPSVVETRSLAFEV